MSKIHFTKPIRSIAAENGQTLMEALRSGGLPVGSSCGGEGICTKCLIEIIDGHENISKPNNREVALQNEHNLPDGHRISCQATILGDITVDTSYW